MAICGKCGNTVNDGVKFCPTCGAPIEVKQQQQQQRGDFSAKFAEMNNTSDTTGSYDPRDIAENKVMAVLAYLGILWLVPFFVKKDSPYTRYHCKQGLNLLVCEIIYTVVSSILRAVIKVPYSYYGYYYGSYTPGWLSTILWVISIPLMVLAVIGIINAVNGKAKELPIIGKINIIK